MDENKEKLTPAPEQDAAQEPETSVTDETTTETEAYNQEVQEAAQAAEDAAEDAAEEAAGEAVEDASEKTAEAAEASIAEAGEELNAAAETELPAEAEASEFGDGISDDLRELQDAADNIMPPKKKRTLMAPIIVSLCIVLVAVAAVLIIKVFFNNGIEGSWYYEREIQTEYTTSTTDEPPTEKVGYYFIFEGNGKLTVKSGTISGSGSYTYRTGSVEGEPIGKPVVDISYVDPLYRTPVEASMAVEVSGNIFSGKTLKLSSFENAESSVTFTSKNYEMPELKLDNDFVADKELEGKWVIGQSSYGVYYSMVYDIRSDGTMTVTSSQYVDSTLSGTGKSQEYTVSTECKYTCQKGKLELVYNATKNQKQEIPYSINKKGDILTLKDAQEVNLYKMGTASADEIMDSIAKSKTENQAATEAVTEAATEAATQAATEKSK